jgi:hypothetical protein
MVPGSSGERMFVRGKRWLLAAAVPVALAGSLGVDTAGTKAAKVVCDLTPIYSISGESSATDDRQTASWSILRANGWTVFAPNGSWSLSASDQGADVVSPNGLSDASLGNYSRITSPYTVTGLRSMSLTGVSRVHFICQSAVERSSGGTTQATELTGVYRGEAIHAVIIASVINESIPNFFDGQIRSLYTPSGQWSAANERQLMLIIKRAIPAVDSLGSG